MFSITNKQASQWHLKGSDTIAARVSIEPGFDKNVANIKINDSITTPRPTGTAPLVCHCARGCQSWSTAAAAMAAVAAVAGAVSRFYGQICSQPHLQCHPPIHPPPSLGSALAALALQHQASQRSTPHSLEGPYLAQERRLHHYPHPTAEKTAAAAARRTATRRRWIPGCHLLGRDLACPHHSQGRLQPWVKRGSAACSAVPGCHQRGCFYP